MNTNQQDDEFVSINDFKHTHIDEQYMDNLNDEEFENNGITIYQLQSNKNNTHAIIMKAGIMKKPHDVLINEFVIGELKCFIVSKLYTIEQLKELDEFCRFAMVKIIACDNKSSKPILQLCYNFNTQIHKQNDKSIIDYLSDSNNKNDKKELNGFFSVTMHYFESDNPKYINLENKKRYCGRNEMIDTLVKWLITDQVKNFYIN